MIVNFTKEQIDFVKHCGEHFEVLTGGKWHSKTKQIIEQLQQENKQLKDNWNKLKEIAKSQSGFKKRADLKGGLWFEIDELLDKMTEIEQGSDNNVKNS